MSSLKFSPTKNLIASACSYLVVSTVMALPFAMFIPLAQAQSRLLYVPPNDLGTPIVSTPGATRSAGCTTEKDCLIGLVPNLVTGIAPVPLTISERPTIYLLIPQVDGNVSFTLFEEDSKLPKGRKIYKTTFYLKSKAGIIAFKIPDHVQGLKIGKNYSWEFVREFASEDLSNLQVIGSIRRVLPNQNLVNQLKEVSRPVDRAVLFAQEGIWYETVQTLAEALQDNPKQAEIASEWNELLKSAKLNRVLSRKFVKMTETSSKIISKPSQNYGY